MPDPKGRLSHAGVGEGDDVFTVSVWENREAYDAFASRFGKALGAEGFEGGKPHIPPVHHAIDHGVAVQACAALVPRSRSPAGERRQDANARVARGRRHVR